MDAKIAREEGEVSLCGVKSERERERDGEKGERGDKEGERGSCWRYEKRERGREREEGRKRGIKGETGMKRKRDSCRE